MNTLDKQYTDLLKDILKYGIKKEDRTGTGTLSVFGRQIRHKMSEGFPILTTKEVHFKSVVTELLWFLRGDTNIQWLVQNGCNIWNGDAYKKFVENIRKRHSNYYNPISKKEYIKRIKIDDDFAKQHGKLGPIYGKQWRSWETYDNDQPPYLDVDQIKNLIEKLKTNPDSRRLMVSAWNVAELDDMVLPPCHYGFQIYTKEQTLDERKELYRNNQAGNLMRSEVDNWDYTHDFFNRQDIPSRKISLMWNQRSVDVFLGLPFNISSYGLLLEILAKEVNMIPDELIGNLGDTHLYLNHVEQAKEQIGKRIPKKERYEMWLTGNYRVKPTESLIEEYNQLNHMTCVQTNTLTAFGVPERTREPFELPTLNEIPDYLCKKDDWECYTPDDITLNGYKHHPKIPAPLSN